MAFIYIYIYIKERFSCILHTTRIHSLSENNFLYGGIIISALRDSISLYQANWKTCAFSNVF